jgi:hypothetical protein
MLAHQIPLVVTTDKPAPRSCATIDCSARAEDFDPASEPAHRKSRQLLKREALLRR